MNTEDSEFKRIEAEAKRRAAQDDDDTQVYTSEVAEAYSYRCGYEAGVMAEREACAGLAEKRLLIDNNNAKKIGYNHACKSILADIRARGQA